MAQRRVEEGERGARARAGGDAQGCGPARGGQPRALVRGGSSREYHGHAQAAARRRRGEARAGDAQPLARGAPALARVGGGDAPEQRPHRQARVSRGDSEGSARVSRDGARGRAPPVHGAQDGVRARGERADCAQRSARGDAQGDGGGANRGANHAHGGASTARSHQARTRRGGGADACREGGARGARHPCRGEPPQGAHPQVWRPRRRA
mmetsp:Transcript_11851/g.38976  ORF Transcript_11851/g.38976 Transcript_11851/m.38976 type:complete len:210 (+) Transcript_11851:1455-2084(+)